MVFDLVHEYVHYRNNQREEKRKLKPTNEVKIIAHNIKDTILYIYIYKV